MNDMSFFPQQHYNKLIHDTYIDIQEESIFVSFGNRILHEHFFNSTNSLGKIYTDLINNLYSEHKHYAKYFWLKKYFLNCLKEFRETVQEPNMEEELKLNTIESWIDLFKSA